MFENTYMHYQLTDVVWLVFVFRDTSLNKSTVHTRHRHEAWALEVIHKMSRLHYSFSDAFMWMKGVCCIVTKYFLSKCIQDTF